MSAATGMRGTAGAADLSRADVRLVQGRLATDELAAIAVVVAAMSVTSRLEAEERSLADGRPGVAPGAWSDPAHCHPRSPGLHGHASPTAWLFSDR